MAEWVNPITNRTSSDVSNAKASQASLTDSKGAYNVSDLNRVNNNMLYLKNVLAGIGYTVTLSQAIKVWVITDVPTTETFNNYLADIEVIRSTFTRASTTPITPTATAFNYTKANDIEKILDDTKTLINNIIAAFYYCGEVFCGELY